MRLLRRSGSEPPREGVGVWATSPEWASDLAPGHVEYLAGLVQKELGTRRIPDAATLRDFANAAELSLPRLLPTLMSTKMDQWPSFLHDFFEHGRAFREAGEAIEARSQTLAAATEHLRIHWLPAANAPAGDLVIPGPIPETVELLVLDAGNSIRHVSERLFKSWNVSVDEAVQLARDRVVTLPLTRKDWRAHGHPKVHIVSLEREGPYAGALLARLDEVTPDAIGTFGTLVGAPVENALAYRALNAGPDLREDLLALALFTVQFADDQGAEGFLRLPIWRRPDGRTELVAFQISDDGELLGSHVPAFSGVLAALDPQELEPVPGWAYGILSGQAYTRFAGCVSVTQQVRPDEVAMLGSALNLATIAAACSGIAFDQWPGLIDDHLASMTHDADAAERLVQQAPEDPAALQAGLTVWLVPSSESYPENVTVAVGETGFQELLGVYSSGAAMPLPADIATAAGHVDELLETGRRHVQAALKHAPSSVPFLSGEAATVTGLPSPTAAIPRLLAWLPDVVGTHGALVAVGDGERLDVLPINDASAVLDLPALCGLAVGRNIRAAWPIEPTVFWLAPDRIEKFSVTTLGEILTDISTSADLTSLVASLPVEPRRLPQGLDEILGVEGASHFYGLLQAAIIDRLATNPAGLTELSVPNIRDAAGLCRSRPTTDWPTEIGTWLDAMAGPRRALDDLTLQTDYGAVVPSLALRVAREALAGSELTRDIGGGLVIYPTIDSGTRYRRVTHAMIDRWGVDMARCHADAAVNAAHHPQLVDEPMYPDQPSVMQIYANDSEREAAAACLHLRHPGSRRGFAVSFTHGSRAHYVRLDDDGSIQLIPIFAAIVADIYRRADQANDAHSPWLFWLTPDGRILELFDMLQPMPRLADLPAEFVAMATGGGRVRPH